jgi:branched-chain amino acid transport system ATP-binding protein
MLSIEKLAAGYGGVTAVHDVSLAVREAQVVVLLGANGAGKTTVLRALSGLIRPTAGTITFLGEPIARKPSHVITRAGLLQVPEGRAILATLTVDENLVLGSVAARRGRRDRETRDWVLDLFPVLSDRLRQAAGSLSGGEQQMLAIGRALMGNPKLLLLDEPTIGLAPRYVDLVFDVVKRLKERQLSILLVEQHVRRALDVSDYCYVMNRGRIVRADEPEKLGSDERFIADYFGEGG